MYITGRTVSTNYFSGIKYWNNLTENSPENSYVIYSGDESFKRSLANVLKSFR